MNVVSGSGLPGWDPVPAFFGEPWASEVCERGRRAQTPIGALCWLCKEMVLEGHRGTWIAQYSNRERRKVSVPVHRECLMRAIVGPVAHLERRCLCFGILPREHDRSYREESLAVWKWLEARRFQVPDAALAGKPH